MQRIQRSTVAVVVSGLVFLPNCSVANGFDEPSPKTEPIFDIVIRGGRIIDGTGNPWFIGDVAISPITQKKT